MLRWLVKCLLKSLVILILLVIASRMLEGEYWTGRCTTGQMKLTFSSRQLVESFPENA